MSQPVPLKQGPILRAPTRFGWGRVLMVFYLLFTCLFSTYVLPDAALALAPGAVTITAITPFAASDSNNPCTAGPRAMYIQINVTNTSGGPLTNLSANFNGFSNGAFTLDAGESPVRYIGNLAAGASTPLYYYVNYPCVIGSTTNYTVTVSDANAGTVTSGNLTLTTRSEISALAGGQVTSATLGPGAVVGQIIPLTVNYSFGNPAAGADAMIQPAGNVGYDGGCFRLVSADITSSTFTTGPLTSTDDRLYFTNVNGPSSNTLTVVYYFVMLCNGASTSADPFSDLQSGTQEKYTGNFGSIPINFPTTTNPFTITKSVSPTNLPTGGTATYTVKISNNSTFASLIDNITDVLPAGVTFGAITAASQVTAANSSSIPTGGATGTISFKGQPTTTCAGGTCNGSYKIAANSTLTLVYTATVPNVPGSYTNSATTTTGSSTTGPATATVNVGSADLSLTKTATGNFTVGQNGTYTLTVTNNGPASAAGPITVTDTLPAGLTFVSGSGTGWNCSATGQNVTCTNAGNLAANASSAITLTVGVGSAAAPSVSNSATVSSATSDNNSANNTGSTTTPVDLVADLAITKTHTGNFTVGQNGTYTLTVTNNGPSPASPVTVTDTLPAGLTFVSGTGTNWSCSATGQNVTCLNSAGLNASSNSSITLTVAVTSSAPTSLTNSASVSSPATDPTSGNNSASDPTTVNQLADLSIQKTVDNPNPTPGSNVTYTIAVTNVGPSTATNVAVSDQLPAGLTFVSDTGGGAYNSGTGIWTVGTLTNGQTATLQITATVPNPIVGTYLNTATISGSDQTDPGASNNSSSVSIPSQSVDLALTKTVSNATPNVGSNVTFTLTVTNNGPNSATNVTVNDLLPAGLTFVSANPSQGTYNNSTGLWALGATPINNGGTATIQIVATVTGTGPYTNNGQITGQDQTDINSANNTASVSLTGQSADISLSKTVNNPAPNQGSNVTFTITATNNGPGNATGVSVSDVLPAGLTFVSATPSIGSYDNTSGVWTIVSLNNGASGNLQIVATVTSGASVTNTVSVLTSDQPDPNSSNNSASASVSPQSADLAVTKTVNNSSPTVGSNVTYTITVVNNGPSDTTGVTVNDTLPAGLTFVSATPGQGTYTSGTGIWAVGILTNGAKATLQIVATVTSAGTITNSATATSSLPDPTAGNNTGSVAVSGQSADLAVAKTVNNATPSVGSNVTYTITVTNNGPSDTTGVTVNDTLPAGLTFVSATPGQGIYTSGTGIWMVGSLTNGASANLQITATVTGAGSITNTASATSSLPDPNSANNSASAAISGQSADLAVIKTVNNSSPTVGSNVTYTITVVNNGPSDTTGVTVNDTLPAGLTFVSVTPSQGTYNSGTGIWTVGNLANGLNATLQITATVNSAGSITNTATASSNLPDPTAGNNTGSVAVSGQSADLSLTKTVDNSTPSVGSNVTYTITVTNQGPSDTTGVTVNDTLPAGLTFVSATPNQGIYTSGTGIWAVGNLTNGASAYLKITATVTGAGSITNSATATSNLPDPNSSNSTASTAVNGQSADLALTKTVSNSSPTAGNNVTYTITVVNNGPSDATGVAVTDQLPAGLTFVSASASQGAYTSGTGIWTVGSLTNGLNATLQIVATVTGTTQVTNTAQISGSNQPDPNGANNSGSVSVTGVATLSPTTPPVTTAVPTTTTVATPVATTPAPTPSVPATATATATPEATATPAPASPVVNKQDPYLVKVSDAQMAVPGQTVKFTITVTNPGSVAADNLVTVDNVPLPFVVQDATASQGTVKMEGQKVTVEIGTLAAGGNVTITVTTLVTGGTNGMITNSATLSGNMEGRSVTSEAEATTALPGLPNTGQAPVNGDDDAGLWRWGLIIFLLMGGCWLVLKSSRVNLSQTARGNKSQKR